MPKTTRDLNRQTMTQLARQHDNLSAMMTFMRNEVGKNMRNIEWKITPGVRRGWRDNPTAV
jgi:hypothetical protein